MSPRVTGISDLPPVDHPEVQRLAGVLLGLPAEHRDGLITTVARVAVAWRLRADLSDLVRFARSVQATAWLCERPAARAALLACPAPVADASRLRPISDAFDGKPDTGGVS